MKKNFLYFYSTVCAVLLFSSCTETPKPVMFDLSAAKKAIEARNSVFTDAFSKGDAVGMANCYTVDAKFMASNSPVVIGRNNIQTAMSEFLKAGVGHVEGKTTEVWGNESLITEEGVYTLSAKDGKVLDHGKYLSLWKMEDGVWKLFRDCSSSDVPMPMPEPMPMKHM